MAEQTPPANPANGPPRIEATSPAEFPKPNRSNTVDTTDDVFFEAAEEPDESPRMERLTLARSTASYMSKLSTNSVPPAGSILTGKQEHYLKRELVSQQTRFEITELSSPTALQRFGAPFRSDAGEVSPRDSELPLLRYMFVHHVRNFPFLDQAREKEFWQDKLQVFLESFANKHISGSEDRLEETKRRKLAAKAEKLVELMMVSGIPTASGYEERIRFSEMEVVDRGADENGLVVNKPQGHPINGWDVNVAGVHTISVKRHVRYHTHAEYILRVQRHDHSEVYVGRKWSDFVDLHKRIRLELPGKVLPPLPRRNKKNSYLSAGADDDGDTDSLSSVSTQDVQNAPYGGDNVSDSGGGSGGGLRSYLPLPGASHRRNTSKSSLSSSPSRRPSGEGFMFQRQHVLYREEQRVSLRAFLRTFLKNETIANSKAMAEFLTGNVVTLNEEEMEDIERRKEMDEKRVEEQKKFYEIARARAAELDVHMEKFRREIVEANGLSHLFQEIRVKNRISELKPEYQKFAEWCRIEVAATIYHLFLAEDNSPDLFAQLKRIHSMVPYTVMKNVIRIANPAAVMSGVLDLFLAQPFGSRSLLQRIFGMAINDGVNAVQKTIDNLSSTKIKDPVLCEKIRAFTNSDEAVKGIIRQQAETEQVDILVAILRSDFFEPTLSEEQIGAVFNAYVAWNNAVENVDVEMRQGAEQFAHLKQLLKLSLRQRDKKMMLEIIEEPTTLQLFRDLFTIFYEPLVRVYKSANVYSSITDFAVFVDDIIRTVEAAQRADISADPNQTVQAFIDLCARHEDNLYKFIHEVHIHDNGLFDQLMGWIEGILEFLRKGPPGGGKLDMNGLFQAGLDSGMIDRRIAVREINSLIKWQTARKKWHSDKTRQKMAQGGDDGGDMVGMGIGGFTTSDFGLHADDLVDLNIEDEDDDPDSLDESDDDADPIVAERHRRLRRREQLKSTAGEPQKPPITELRKLHPSFLSMLRDVLAE
ncbi:px domain-containing protein [Diplodia corticola]|uniref:Px domain-containing protein n=1 Tax=Diplodia corticola TaxID=236234 RepID=A0A1J9RA50_9PEZI|nr:px domain-containing protein [Diplodia corticola]OJD29299.1 px domain-containing protein [Diplodia corticola]